MHKTLVCWNTQDPNQFVEYDQSDYPYINISRAQDIAAARGWDRYDYGTNATRERAVDIEAQKDERESYKEALDDHNADPPLGTYACTARMMVELGFMSGEEADIWKDRMKDGLFD